MQELEPSSAPPCPCRDRLDSDLPGSRECVERTGHDPACPEAHAIIRHRNHRGEVGWRTVVPFGFKRASTHRHPEVQWLMNAWDVLEADVRSFAVRDILAWGFDGHLRSVIGRLVLEGRLAGAQADRLVHELAPPIPGLPPTVPERVLCIPRSAFEAAGVFQGFRTGPGEWLDRALRAAELRPRTKGPGGLEEDPAWKQVVAYVLMCSPAGRYAVFRRTGGEGRLVGKLTLGLGGHVEAGDFPTYVGDRDLAHHGAIRRAARRELAEEVEVNPPLELRRVGLVSDDSDAVGQVHLGVVYLATLPDDHCIVRDEGLDWFGWGAPDQLGPLTDRFESWSRLLIEGLIAP